MEDNCANNKQHLTLCDIAIFSVSYCGTTDVGTMTFDFICCVTSARVCVLYDFALAKVVYWVTTGAGSHITLTIREIAALQVYAGISDACDLPCSPQS